MALKSPKWRFIYFNYKIDADDGGVLLPYHSFSWSLDTHLSICGPPYEFIRFTLVLPLEKRLHIFFLDMQTFTTSSYRAPRASNFFSGSFTLTCRHVSNAKALGPSILKIFIVIRIQCFGVFWQAYWFSSQYDKFKNLIYTLRINVLSFVAIGP